MQEKYPIIGDVRGKGLMVGAELVKDQETKEPAAQEATEVINKCFRRGLAIITSGKSTIRFAPPLIITRETIDAALLVLEGAIKEVSAQLA
jgi:4-aminobutyrate aminotransferase-like enzyme